VHHQSSDVTSDVTSFIVAGLVISATVFASGTHLCSICGYGILQPDRRNDETPLAAPALPADVIEIAT
jgi:hypothetical protein